ncbi:MAG: hypothetical protein JNK02_16485 [Planctomycetes bacterium]|nr:hypothetical protein [Planctomycetota bacterium]
MKLVALTIERLPGIRGGLRLAPEHLDGRVRVLHGPNGIGKSSLVRALKALLWPRESGFDGTVELEARFEFGGATWTARRAGPATRWTRDGVESPPPALPSWERAAQMLIRLDDLGLGREGDVEEHLRRELGGGVDLASFENQFSLGAGPKQERELRDADAALRQVEIEQEAVIREALELDETTAELGAARAAREHVATLERARELARARARLAQAQAELTDFPRGLDRLRGQELETLDGLRAQHGEIRARLDASRRSQEQAAREIAALGGGERATETGLDELDQRIEALRAAQEELNAAERQRAACEARTTAAGLVFGAGADLERLTAFDAALEAEVEEFVRASSQLAASREAVRAQLAALGPAAEREPPPTRAIAALEDWLAAPGEPGPAPHARLLLVLIGAGLVILAGALAVTVHPGWAAILLLALVAFLGARERSAARGPSRADHQDAFQRTGADAPRAWTAEAVRARLDELRGEERVANMEQGRAQRRRELAELERSQDAQAQELAERRRLLAARIGTPAQAPDGAYLEFVRARRVLREERAQLGEATTLVDSRRVAREAGLREVNAGLRALGATEVADVIAARTRLADLRRRSTQLAQLQADTQRERVQEERERVALERCEQEIAQVFRAAGLEPGDDAELARRVERLGGWNRARRACEDAQRDVSQLQPDVPVELAELGLEVIEEQLAATRRSAQRADDLQERVTRIRTRLDDARQGRALEDARALRDERRAALTAARSTACRRALARALVADVRAAHEATSRPRLVEQADALLKRFTHGRYGLEPVRTDAGIALAARDADDNAERLGLTQLSDGTRAQLLLAARLAYLREIEHGDPLPVVLDDALATSDPARKREIGASLLEVARAQDRQFLVLTTDEADVDLLRPAHARPGEVEATALRDVRRLLAPAVARERLEAPTPPRVPDPAGRSAADYALDLEAVGMPVAPLDPARPVEDAHLWWILQHDLELLHRLLERRLQTVGRLRNVALAGRAFPGERELAAAAPWVELARTVLDAWRIGRGRPLDRGVLERVGVTDDFIDRMTELARDLDWDAKRWIAALEARTDPRTSRYRTKTIDQNREALAREGYLDERATLDLEEAWGRVLAALPEGHGIEVRDLRARFELLWRACGT